MKEAQLINQILREVKEDEWFVWSVNKLTSLTRKEIVPWTKLLIDPSFFPTLRKYCPCNYKGYELVWINDLYINCLFTIPIQTKDSYFEFESKPII